MNKQQLCFRVLCGIVVFVFSGFALQPAAAQENQLVASLEVLTSGVEVRRVNTLEWVPVRVETLIGQGDSVRTDSTGTVLVTFFADGAEVRLTPNTELTIRTFTGNSENFSLSVEILAGITHQQFQRLLNSGSSYQVVTPGAVMTVRGTTFDIRVEESGRSSALTEEGLVATTAQGREAEVPAGFGIRVEPGSPLSEVVPATTFDELDSALDGCPGEVTTEGDVRLNVRLGPGIDYERIGSIDPSEIAVLMGVTQDNAWYRFQFSDGYGWFSAANMAVSLNSECPPLRRFDNSQAEDTAQYGMIGDQDTTVRVIVPTANLRSGPGIAYRRVDIVQNGDQLTLVGRIEDNSWLRVLTDDGQTGWISASLVSVATDLDRIGVVPADEIQPGTAPEATPVNSGDASAAPTPTTP